MPWRIRVKRSLSSPIPQRTKQAVWPHLKKPRMKRPRWTKADMEQLKLRYGNETAAHIAAYLGRTEEAVVAKANLMGLRSKGGKLYKCPHNKGKVGVQYANKRYRREGDVWQACGRMFTKYNGRIMPYARYLAIRRGDKVVGRVVIFIDGDPLNCELDNIRTISRKEHAARNYMRCKDKELRRMRLAMAGRRVSWVDAVLMGL